MAEMNIVMLPWDAVEPNPWNPNRMTERVLQAERESILAHGFIDPITVRPHPEGGERWQIVDGEHRYRTLKSLAEDGGVEADGDLVDLLDRRAVPAIVLDLDDVQAKKLTIILNETRGRADAMLLTDLLRDIEMSIGRDDLALALPYNPAELDTLLTRGELPPPPNTDGPGGLEDRDPPEAPEPKAELTDPVDEPDLPPPPKEPITKPGDVIHLGRHRLVCGDATVMADVDKLMEGRLADLVNTDPPYGVSYQSNMSKRFDVLENDDTVLDVAPVVWSVMGENTAALVWTSQQVYPQWRDQFQAFYKSTVIWSKGGGGMGDLEGDFAPNYEMALFCVKGRPTFLTARPGAVWTIGKDAASAYEHPTQKPVALAQKAIEHLCPVGGLVVDLFGGAGFTLLAAEATAREARVMELSPAYCDVIVSRWERMTGKKAKRPKA